MDTSASELASFETHWSRMIMSTFTFALDKWCTHLPHGNPRSAVTCLDFWEEHQPFAMNLQRAVLTYESFCMGVWRLDKTAHIGPFTWKAPGPNCADTGDRGRAVFEQFFKSTVVLLLGSHFTTPTCAVEVALNKIKSSLIMAVRTAMDTFGAILRFLATWLWQYCKARLASRDFHTTASMAIHCNTQCPRARGPTTLEDLVQMCPCQWSGRPSEVSHMKLAGDVFMLMKLHRFLESNHVLWSSNVIFNDSWRATFGTWIPAQDAQRVFVQVATRRFAALSN